MEITSLTLTMYALLFATLVTVSNWGHLGLSLAEDEAQRCCEELDMLAEAFPGEDSACLEEKCTPWLTDMRTSFNYSETSCPVSEKVMCEKFANISSSDRVRASPNPNWSANTLTTVQNILRVVNTQTWRDCFIAYDASAWLIVNDLIASLDARDIEFVMYDISALNQSFESMKRMAKTVFDERDIRNVIVLAGLPYLEAVFRAAEAHDTLLGRISGLRMFTRWIVATSGGSQEQVTRAAAYFDNVVAIFEEPQIFESNEPGMINKKLQCVTTEISTLMYRGNRTRELQSVTLLHRDKGGQIIVNDTFPNTRFGFNKRELTIGTKEWPPFVSKVMVSSTGAPQYKGICMDLLDELARVLNFSYKNVEPEWHEGWGARNASGFWQGLVGMLHRQEVDVVVSPIQLSQDKALVLDSTYPFFTSYLSAVFRKPDPNLDKWKIYLRPFRGEVLLCLAVTLLMVTCIVHAMAWMDPTSKKEEQDNEDKEKDKEKENVKKKGREPKFPGPSPDDGFWYLYGALLSQGGMFLPKSGSSRMLVASWWLFCIVMSATYSGNLIAFLTVQLQTKPFETMGMLLDQDDYSWGVAEKSSQYKILMGGVSAIGQLFVLHHIDRALHRRRIPDRCLKAYAQSLCAGEVLKYESTNPTLKALGEKIQDWARSDPDILNANPSVQKLKVEAGGYAHITDSVTTEAWTRENCDLDRIVDRSSVAFPVGIYLPRGSAYTRLFDEYVMRIVEAGLMEKWKRDWFADSLLCAKSPVTSSPEITVLDVQSVLYVGVIGFGIALISLAVEFLCHRHPKLRSWTNKVGEACVNGCEEETMERGSHEGRKTTTKDHEVVIVPDEEGKPSFEVFDLSSIGWQHDFVYYTAEDFGRVVNGLVLQPTWGRVQTKHGRISDDVKVTT